MKNILNKQVFFNIKFHIFIISAILVTAVWGLFYYDTYQIAQSESGIFFYPSYLFQDSLNSWSSYYFGSRNSIFLTYHTFIFRFFIYPEFPFPFIVQFTYYLLLFSLGYYGFYLLLNLFYESSKNTILKLYISLIIIFNPASLSVLLRFQYPYITFFYLLPLIFYLTIKAFSSINLKKFLFYTFILNVLLSLYSIIYAAMPTLIILLVFWGTLSLIYLVLNFNFTLIKRLGFFYLIWFVLNSFWLVPFLIEYKIPNYLYDSKYQLDENINISTLNFFSERDSNILGILSLHTQEYLTSFSGNNLFFKYLFTVISLIPLTILFIFLCKFLVNFKIYSKKTNKNIIFLVIIAILFFFITRGSNFPFTNFYIFVFEKINFLQVFRNPFEKGILLFYLPYLLCISIISIYLFESKNKKFFIISFLAIYILSNSLIIFSSRLLLGNIDPFKQLNKGFRIEIPPYYDDVSKIINQKNKENTFGRTLVLPLVQEGITYNWNYGYIGVDIIHQYLSNNAYSFLSPDRFYDRSSILKNIIFSKDKVSLLNLFNFNYIVSRNDYNFSERNQINPEIINKFFLNDYYFEFSNMTPLSNIIISSSTRKINNVFDGSSHYGSSDIEVESGWNSNSFITISVDRYSTIPTTTPFIFIIHSPDIKSIKSFEFKAGGDLPTTRNIFKNDRICKDCYVTEVILNNDQESINSFNLELKLKEKKQKFKINSVYILYPIKNQEKLPLQELYSNQISLFLNNSSPKLFKCFSEYEVYENISNFIFEEIDTDRKVYIKDSQFPEILNNKKLSTCEIEYTKLSQSEYEIFIEPRDSKEKISTILNFNDSADSLWKIVYLDENFFKSINFEKSKNHFISNIYANSFLLENIPPEGVKLKLVYLPYIFFKVLFTIAMVFWIIYLIFFIKIAKEITKK